MATSITYTFTPITVRRSKKGLCPVCGKRAQRSRTFTHTVNPYHPALSPTMSQQAAEEAVRNAVKAEADAWVPDFTHTACSNTDTEDSE